MSARPLSPTPCPGPLPGPAGTSQLHPLGPQPPGEGGASLGTPGLLQRRPTALQRWPAWGRGGPRTTVTAPGPQQSIQGQSWEPPNECPWQCPPTLPALGFRGQAWPWPWPRRNVMAALVHRARRRPQTPHLGTGPGSPLCPLGKGATGRGGPNMGRCESPILITLRGAGPRPASSEASALAGAMEASAPQSQQAASQRDSGAASTSAQAATASQASVSLVCEMGSSHRWWRWAGAGPRGGAGGGVPDCWGHSRSRPGPRSQRTAPPAPLSQPAHSRAPRTPARGASGSAASSSWPPRPCREPRPPPRSRTTI